MKLSDSSKFWTIFVSILIAAFFGGILGNWVFIYLLDKYYGIPGGNYLAAPVSSPVIVRDSKKIIVEQDNRIAQAISAADRGSMKIFKKGAASYEAKDAVITAAIITSDGWLVSPAQLPIDKTSGLSNYEAVSPDRRRFSVEKTVIDPITGLSFIHLTRAQNLSVSGFVTTGEMSTGQTLIALGFDNAVEVGRLSRFTNRILASEGVPIELSVSDIGKYQAYIYDAAGDMAGVATGKTFIAMDSVQSVLEKLLTEGKITHPRLGLYYLDLSKSYGSASQTGALITTPDAKTAAIVVGSPAEKAGLKVGDIITAVDGTAVNEFNNLSSILAEYRVGDLLNLSITRNKETKTVAVKLDEIPAK